VLRLSTATFIRRDVMGSKTRVRQLVAISGLVLLGLVAVMAVLLVRGANGMIASGADARARHGADLLVNVGPTLPRLSAAGLVSLSRTDVADLDRAVVKGRQEGVISGVAASIRASTRPGRCRSSNRTC
jgi:hypothetical protein